MIYLQFCIFNLDSPLKMLYDLPESVVTASDVVLSKTVEKRVAVSAASVVSDWTVGVASEVVTISVVVSSVVLVVCWSLWVVGSSLVTKCWSVETSAIVAIIQFFSDC